MIRPQADLAEFKQWCAEVAPAARAVLMARAYAELTRERVDAYVRPIFDGYGFTYCGDLVDKVNAGNRDRLEGPLPSPKELYLCDDPLVQAFYDDCDAAHRRHGFTGPQGHCPALTAEHLVVETEHALIDLAKPLFGVESHHLWKAEERARYLDLLIGGCLKAEEA